MLEAKGLKKYFRRTRVQALAGVSLELAKAETLGLVGESGSGKSTLARIFVGLEKPDEGSVRFQGKSLQMIFQHPLASLDPRWSVFQILAEPLVIRRERSRDAMRDTICGMLRRVGLGENFLSRRPKTLSGGECQKVSIARALLCQPDLLICDEAVASLDTLAKAEILRLLLSEQEKSGLSLLFISHDLPIVRAISRKILTLQNGKLVL